MPEVFEPPKVFEPPIKQIVEEIFAINHAWKVARELFNPGANIALSFRELKTQMQVRLLRKFAPNLVYLKIDDSVEADDPELQEVEHSQELLYGLILRSPIGQYWNAAHLPVRRAREVLTAEELQEFTQL